MTRFAIANSALFACTIAAICIAPAGCGPSTQTQHEDAAARVREELGVVGAWGEAVNGLRARVLLASTNLQGQGIVRAAVEVENVSGQARMVSAGMLRNAIWQVGDARLVFPHAVEDKESWTIEPGKSIAGGEILLPIPPGRGARGIAAVVDVGGAAAVAREIAVSVGDSDWGVPDNGVRAALVAERRGFRSDEPPILYLFIQNLRPARVTIHPPDFATLAGDARGGLNTINCRTLDDAFVDLGQNQAWVARVPDAPLLVPGMYQVKMVISSPELSADKAPAWFGKIISNEVEVEIGK
jgi:hypothetical protein